MTFDTHMQQIHDLESEVTELHNTVQEQEAKLRDQQKEIEKMEEDEAVLLLKIDSLRQSRWELKGSLEELLEKIQQENREGLDE